MQILSFFGVSIYSFALLLFINVITEALIPKEKSFLGTDLSLSHLVINIFSGAYYFSLLKLFFTCLNYK